MFIATRLLSVSAAALFLASGLAVDELAFHAEEGTSVTRTLDREVNLELDQIEITVNGQEIPPEYMEGVEISLRDAEHIVVVDEFGALGDGRPALLRRTFEELTGVTSESSTGPEGESDESSKDKSSPLEGSTVVFTWDEEEQEYSAEFDDGGDEDLLERLVEDMDMRGLLPSGAVEEGDSWEPDIEAFKTLFEAGGELALRAEDDERSDLDVELSDNLDGEVRVTYAGTRTEDGIEVAVLELEVTVETEGEGVEEDDDAGEVQSAVAMQFELEGELLWNLEAGHLHSVELAGSLSSQITNISEMDGGGEMMEFIQELSLEGTFMISIAVEEQ